MSLAVKRFNIVRMILYKSIFDENVIHIILTEYWKNLKNKSKILLDWINLEQLTWHNLSRNPNAIDLLEQYKNNIDWKFVSLNPNAIHLLEKNKHKIDWSFLSTNPNAIHLLENNEDEIDWNNLSKNPNAIHLLENNLDKINWFMLSANPSIFEDEPMPIV